MTAGWFLTYHEVPEVVQGWLARLGVRIKGDLATAAGRLQPYGRLNFYRANFGGDAAVFIGPAASTAIGSEGSYSAGEVAAGATLALTSTTSLYGEIGHQWNIGGDANDEITRLRTHCRLILLCISHMPAHGILVGEVLPGKRFIDNNRHGSQLRLGF